MPNFGKQNWKHSSHWMLRDTLPVVFRGPFSEIKLDSGHVLRRGCVTQLPSNVVDELKNTPLADLLVVIETATAPVSCTA